MGVLSTCFCRLEKMDNKELRKLNRIQLLELLYEQQTRIEELEKENEDLKTKLEERRVILSKVGSIADASLALTKVFDEAQKSADIYLDSIRSIYQKILSKTRATQDVKGPETKGENSEQTSDQ